MHTFEYQSFTTILVFLSIWIQLSSFCAGDPAPSGRAAGPAAGQLRWEGLLSSKAAETGRRPVQGPCLQPAGERPAGQRASHTRHSTLQVSGVSPGTVCLLWSAQVDRGLILYELCKRSANKLIWCWEFVVRRAAFSVNCCDSDHDVNLNLFLAEKKRKKDQIYCFAEDIGPCVETFCLLLC